MAYNRDEIFKQALKAVKENNLFTVEDVIAWLPCSKSTFYAFFPDCSDELDELRDIIWRNKIKTKSAIRAKLFKSEKGTELFGLYRLIGTPEERQILNQQYIEMRQKHDRELTPEEAKEFAIATLKELTKCDETE